jgi:glucose-6-phosphate isomerase, archaeal
MIPHLLHAKFDLNSGIIADAPIVSRSLSDMKGMFHDQAAFEAAVDDGNPVLYTVSSVEAASGEGQLHYGLGTLMPGKVGREYYMTKGHLHSWRPAAEVYIGLRGKGCMLLEDERTGESRLEALSEGHIVYVPGFTAHRTVNTGLIPLVYIGVYPSNAGHDYGTIADRNFRMVVVERNGKPQLVERSEL